VIGAKKTDVGELVGQVDVAREMGEVCVSGYVGWELVISTHTGDEIAQKVWDEI
jgi:hypothetical protein